MENIKLLKDSTYEDPDKGISNDWEAIWNLPSQINTRETMTQHVKLEIQDTTANLLKKLQADTKRRINKKWTHG